MNKQVIYNVCMAAVVVALLVIVIVDKVQDSKKAEQPVAEAVVADGNLPIAYLNTDSLLVKYEFAKQAADQLMTKQEDARLKLNTKARTLQQEMMDFQRKLDNNAFLSRERAESEQQRLIKKQQDLEELEQKLTQDIMLENQKLNMQLADTLTAFLKEYNADGRFHMILANNAKDNVIMANDGYDITNEVVDALNARFVKK